MICMIAGVILLRMERQGAVPPGIALGLVLLAAGLMLWAVILMMRAIGKHDRQWREKGGWTYD